MRHFIGHNLYGMMELHHLSVAPMRLLAQAGKSFHDNPYNPFSYTSFGRTASAALELFERVTRKYPKPEFGIYETFVDNKKVAVIEERIHHKTFCDLIHFRKNGSFKQQKLLITAPMSGHHATLLRGTVEAMLPHFDVYITDWLDVRNIPASKGNFDLDDYIDYVIEFIEYLGKGINVMAVCQPAVPVIAAVALMSSAKNPCVPANMILIGGPIDARINPTKVNKLAMEKPINWFEGHLITRVPINYPGFMRKVYPGFIQLGSFINMNPDRHIDEHWKFFRHLIKGDGENAEAHKKFYNEYLSVMDLPAEFYLQTIKTVFQDFALPRGKMTSRGRKVDLLAIRKTGLLALEGGLDDISGVGQTKASMTLCKNIPTKSKKYHLQPDVGHYGIFNGRKFKEKVVPVIKEFCYKK